MERYFKLLPLLLEMVLPSLAVCQITFKADEPLQFADGLDEGHYYVTGKDWNGQSNNAHFFVVIVFESGYATAQQFYPKAGVKSLFPDSTTVQDIVTAIDQFYRVPANVPIELDSAIVWASAKINGYPPDKLEELELGLRHRATLPHVPPPADYGAGNPNRRDSGGVALGPNSPFGNRFTSYADLVVQRVTEKWQTAGLLGLHTAPVVIVTFDILRNGSVRNAQVAQHSGNTTLDYSALRAVLDAAPFPPLPGRIRSERS